jgi:hypothetical protein
MNHLLPGVILASDDSAPKNVSAGGIGFVVFVALAVAVTLLWLSFRKQLKKIDFEEEPDEPAPGVPAPEEPAPEEPAPGDLAPGQSAQDGDGAPPTSQS